MDEKLYSKMQWPEIEALVYSEHDRPRQILGPRVTPDGILIAAFNPEAAAITVKALDDGSLYPMEKADEGGYFAVLVDGTKLFPYEYIVDYGEEQAVTQGDPYAFPSQIAVEDIKKFNAGIHYELYRVLGAHVTTIDGVSGVHFAVWAPEAVRVSVVGDFCSWTAAAIRCSAWMTAASTSFLFPALKKGTFISMR